MPDDWAAKLVVPTFSSYKSTDPNDGSAPSGGSSSARAKASSKHSITTEPVDPHSRHSHRTSSQKQDESSRRPKKHHHRKPDRQPSPPPSPPRPASPPLARPRSLPQARQPEQLFVLDPHGDPLITKYGLIGRASEARPLHRAGGGRLLGSHGRLVLHNEGGRTEFSLRFPGDDGPRAHASALGSLRARKPANVAWADAQPVTARGPDASDVTADFVSFESPRKRRRLEGDGALPVMSDSSSEWNGEIGMGSGDDQVGHGSADSMGQTLARLLRRVRDAPHDIDGWLTLVGHQDIVVQANEPSARGLTPQAARGLADVKLSMLESALGHAQSSVDQERVLVPMMREAAALWPTGRVTEKWADILRRHPDSFTLWLAFLNHSLTGSVAFGYDRVRQIQIDRIRFLCRRLAAVDVNGAAREGLLGECIYVFLRLTAFMHDAGYREQAVAAWQALLELNLLRPASWLSASVRSTDDMMAEFRTFWEAEGPRLGEMGSRGWGPHAVADKGGDVTAIEPRMASSPRPYQDVLLGAGTSAGTSADAGVGTRGCGRGVDEAWYRSERRAAWESRMPARTLDDAGETGRDDPYRVVLFDDIADMLFVIGQTQLSAALTEQLIDAFLLFCHVPPVWASSSWIRDAAVDPFLCRRMGALERLASRPSGDAELDAGSRRLPLRQDGLRMVASPWVLFPGPDWFAYVVGPAESCAAGDEPVDYEWVRRTLWQLLVVETAVQDEQADHGLATYCLAWELAANPTGVRSAARVLFQRFPRYLPLYNAYALAEFATGGRDMAEKVLGAAVVLSLQNSGEDADDTCALMPLRLTWAWLHLETGNKAAAVCQLCRAAEPEPEPDYAPGGAEEAAATPSPVRVLTAQTTLADRQTRWLARGAYEHASCAAASLALLEYTTVADTAEAMSGAQGNIQAAVASVQAFSAAVAAVGVSSGLAHERLLQFVGQLLYFHARKGPFRRAFMREQAERFACLFPRNGIFHSLVAWAAPVLRTDYDGAVRSWQQQTGMLDALHDCVANRVVVIGHELARNNIYRAQAALERALEAPRTAACPALWRCYLALCAGLPAVAVTNALYQVATRCPWARDLVLYAGICLLRRAAVRPDGLKATGRRAREAASEAADARAAVDGLVARGLRLHVELDEA